MCPVDPGSAADGHRIVVPPRVGRPDRLVLTCSGKDPRARRRRRVGESGVTELQALAAQVVRAEVAGVQPAATLDKQDAHAGLGQHARSHTSARTGPHHHGVVVRRQIVPGGRGKGGEPHLGPGGALGQVAVADHVPRDAVAVTAVVRVAVEALNGQRHHQRHEGVSRNGVPLDPRPPRQQIGHQGVLILVSQIREGRHHLSGTRLGVHQPEAALDVGGAGAEVSGKERLQELPYAGLPGRREVVGRDDPVDQRTEGSIGPEVHLLFLAVWV